MTFFQKWGLAIRPKTLGAGLGSIIVALGVAASTGNFHWGAACAALVVVVCMQIAANLINDVADYRRGADNEKRIGPLRVTAAGILTPRQVWGGTAVFVFIAVLAGFYLVYLGGWQLILLGAIIILGAAAYSTGPFPLAYYGLGGLFCIVFFGFACVGGTTYVVSGLLPGYAWGCALIPGLFSVAILTTNNTRDRETDKLSRRINIPVLFGRIGGEIEYGFAIIVPYLVVLGLVLGQLITPWTLLFWISLPYSIILILRLHRAGCGMDFNKILAATSLLNLIAGLLFLAGILIGRML